MNAHAAIVEAAPSHDVRLKALSGASVTVDELSMATKRALGHDRRPLNRDEASMARETRYALRLARELVRQLERADANLPAGV